MDLKEYQALAQRTEKPLEIDQALWHGFVGLVTEAGELADAVKKHLIYERTLDTVNVREEVGDIMWYAAVIINNCKLSPNCYMLERPLVSNISVLGVQQTWEFVLMELAGEIGNIATDLLNYRVAIHNAVVLKEGGRGQNQVGILRMNMGTNIERLYNCLRYIAHISMFTLEEAAEENIAKLRKRYPDKYSNEDATARADKEHIEGVLRNHGYDPTKVLEKKGPRDIPGAEEVSEIIRKQGEERG